MAVLHAYFDNSDGPCNTISSFAAVVARPHQWNRFERDWDAVLTRFGVTPPFHMTDYANFAKQYTRFRHDRVRWTALLVELIRTIRTNTALMVADTVVASECIVPDGMENHPGFQDFKDPYTLSMLSCMHHLAKAKREGDLPRGRIVCVFDKDEKRQAVTSRNFYCLAEHEYPDVYDPTLVFGTVRRNVPIQAADVVAFEAMKRMHHVAIEQNDRPIRKSAEALFADDKQCRINCLRQGAAPHLLQSLADYIRTKQSADWAKLARIPARRR